MIAEPFIFNISQNIEEETIDFILNIVSNQSGYIKYDVNLPISLSIESTSLLLGDLNQDTSLSILDIILLLNIILDSEVPTNYQLLAGDINEDSILNILDIISLVNLILQ